jgi:hypothetical protein
LLKTQRDSEKVTRQRLAEAMWKHGVKQGLTEFKAVKDAVIAKFPDTAKHGHITWVGAWKPVKNALEKGIEFVAKSEAVVPPQVTGNQAAAQKIEGQGTTKITTDTKGDQEKKEAKPLVEREKKETRPAVEQGGPDDGDDDDNEGAEGEQKPLDREAVGDHVREQLKQGISLRGLYKTVKGAHGIEGRALVKQVVHRILELRKQGIPMPKQHGPVSGEFGTAFGALVQAVNTIELTANRTKPRTQPEPSVVARSFLTTETHTKQIYTSKSCMLQSIEHVILSRD